MIVALHLDPTAPSVLIGIWTAPNVGETTPRSWYPDDRERERDDAFASCFTNASQIANFEWDQYFRTLTHRAPYSIWWEAAEVDDSDIDDLEALFVVLSASVLASAAALHGHHEGGWTIQMFSNEAAAGLGL